MSNEDRTISREELQRLEQDASASVRAVLHIDGLDAHELRRRVVIGRDPEGSGDVDVVSITGDPLVSKTHLALDVTPDGVVAIDLGSSNGSTVTIGGASWALPTDHWTSLTPGSIVDIGDTSIRVEFDAPPNTSGASRSTLAPPSAGIVTSVPSPADVSTPSSCPSCGRHLVVGSRFCDGCGTSIGAASPLSAPPPAATIGSAPPATSGPPTTAPWAGTVITPQTTAPPLDAVSASVGGSSSRRTKVLAAAGAVAVVAIVLILWQVLTGSSDDGPSATPLPRVSSGVEERWSVDIDGAADAVGSASAVFVLAVDDDDAQVVSLNGGSGDERWSADVARDVSYGSLRGVLDGVVLGDACDFDGACELFGLDASTGDELWIDELDGSAFISSRGTLLTGDSESLELIDPRSGEQIERVRGDQIEADGDYAYVRDNDEVEVFDLQDLSSVFGPVDVDDESVGSVFQGGKLITAVDDELIVINSNADIDRESRVPADSIYRILPGPDGMVIVDTDDGVFGLDPVDGRAEEIWSANGSLSYGFVSDAGPLVIVSTGDDDGADAEVLDARTGDTRIELRGYYETDQLIGSNGLVNLVYDSDTEATAIGYSDGEEIWNDDFDGYVRLIDDGLVEIDEGEVRFYR